jgi:hypothetical protein
MVNSNFTGAKALSAEMAAETEDLKLAAGGAVTGVATGWLNIMPFPTKVAVGNSR